MPRIELPHLRLSAPLHVAIARLRQIREDDRLNATRLMEVGCALCGNCFDLHESRFLGQLDRLFVKLLRFKLATFDTSDLRCEQRVPSGEVRRAAVGPDRKLAVLFAEAAEVLFTVFRL